MVSELERKGEATDLHKLFNFCLGEYIDNSEKKHKPLTLQQIGEMYAVTILKDIPKRLWLSNMQDLDDPQRYAKGDFQKATRVVIYRNVHNLNPDLNTVSRESRLEELQQQSLSLSAIDVRRSNTIEYAIHSLLTRKDSFVKIGEAAVAGAKSYFDEKPADHTNQKYKIFLEYQRIQRELERRL